MARLDSGEVLLELLQLPRIVLRAELRPGGVAPAAAPVVASWLALDLATGETRSVELPVPPGASTVGVASAARFHGSGHGLGFS